MGACQTASEGLLKPWRSSFIDTHSPLSLQATAWLWDGPASGCTAPFEDWKNGYPPSGTTR